MSSAPTAPTPYGPINAVLRPLYDSSAPQGPFEPEVSIGECGEL
jgi:hypothetical protein